MFSKKDIKFNGVYLTIVVEDGHYFVPTLRTYSLLTIGENRGSTVGDKRLVYYIVNWIK